MPQACFTSGGSESILVAMKAARDAWRATHEGQARAALNLVMPVTGHPAHDKAAALMDVEIRRAPLKADCRVDVAEMEPLIDENTIAIVGSAPCFPHGVIDDIGALSELALAAWRLVARGRLRRRVDRAAPCRHRP